MIRDLDSDTYRTREKASKELTAVGAKAVPALQRALAKPPSPEVRLRATRLVSRLDAAELPAEELVAMRGVQALEYMNTPQARELLEKLSRGEADRLSEEAQHAVLRLKRPAAPTSVPSGSGS